MMSTDNKFKSFAELCEDIEAFIKYTAKKANVHFAEDEYSSFEKSLGKLEKQLQKSSRFDASLQHLLYKVLRVKKLLGKLHEALEDINIGLNGEENQAFSKAIRADVSKEELDALRKKRINLAEYYDYNGIRNVILRKLKGEIDDAFFKSWLSFLGEPLYADQYEYITNYFEACSFCEEYTAKKVLEMLATLKDFNYKLNHPDYIAGHEKEKLKVIYLHFLHFNRSADSVVYKAYFVDYKRKRFDVRIIDDSVFDYRDELLYCDVWTEHFDDEGEYIDPDGEYGPEPAELPEEMRLMELFNKKGWVYDHGLDF